METPPLILNVVWLEEQSGTLPREMESSLYRGLGSAISCAGCLKPGLEDLDSSVPVDQCHITTAGADAASHVIARQRSQNIEWIVCPNF